MTTIKNQNFGVEIELTGITRRKAAETISKYFNGNTYSACHAGGSYDTWTATDSKGRKWKAMSDGSIRTTGGHSTSTEVVTPILQYEDMDDLQEIVRQLRENGAIANSSCGIHVHVDGAAHTSESLSRLLNFFIGRQDLFYEALEIGDRANHWCQKVNNRLFKSIKNTNHSLEQLKAKWYSSLNDGYYGGISCEHYNSTRYHGVNLHAFFTKGTVEFRLFNGTTHAGKIKAYVQFCLAMSAWAVNADDNQYYKKVTNYTAEQKKALMNRVLKNRLGMSGKEFKTARYHLTQAFVADIENAA